MYKNIKIVLIDLFSFKKKSEDRQSAILKSLSEFFGEDVWKYKDYREKDWGLEPYIEGSPICSAAPGSMPYFASGLRDSFDR
jgi:monoamine oxidase